MAHTRNCSFKKIFFFFQNYASKVANIVNIGRRKNDKKVMMKEGLGWMGTSLLTLLMGTNFLVQAWK